MNTSEIPDQRRRPAMSSQSIVGIGITVTSLGLLGLLLGWAQQMRSVPDAALICFILGGVLAIAGIAIVAVGGARKRGR